MSNDDKPRIDTLKGLKALEARHAVYWHKLAKGCHIGFRKTGDVGHDDGAWHARFTDLENGNARSQKALGSGLTFTRASELAHEFFATKNAGVDHKYTVEQAINEYVAHRHTNNGYESGHEVELALKKHVPESLRRKPVANLKKGELRQWRNGLIEGVGNNKPLSLTGANRNIADFLSALNMAHDDQHVNSKHAWTKLKFPKKVIEACGVEISRDSVFTPEQEQTLLTLCSGQFKIVVEAALLIGARPPAELINLRVRDFDPFHRTLNIPKSKTGQRIMQLTDKAVTFFKIQARGKLPDAWLIPNDKGIKFSSQAQTPFWKDIRAKNRKLPKAMQIPVDSVLYTCRHTYISRAVAGGVPILALAKNVGTSAEMIEKHYSHFRDGEIAEFLMAAGL